MDKYLDERSDKKRRYHPEEKPQYEYFPFFVVAHVRSGPSVRMVRKSEGSVDDHRFSFDGGANGPTHHCDCG